MTSKPRNPELTRPGPIVFWLANDGHRLNHMTFVDQIEPLKKAALAEFDSAGDLAALEQSKVNYLGLNGKFTALLKQLGALPREEKPAAGKLINQCKAELE